MGIGTSLGAYFETSLDHHAGNEYLLNPNSTPDNNELSTNEVMPKPDEEPKVIPIADIKTASPLVTITDEDIDKGIGLALSFSGGGLTTGKVLPMRKAANDNKKLQIDDPVMDAGIQASWDRMVRGQQIVTDRQTLINTQSERALNDIEKARLNKLDKEHAKHFGNYYPD